MSYGITPAGFNRKPYQTTLEEMQAKARELYGSDIDLGDASPLGLHVKLMAWAIDREWGIAEDVYYSLFISTAEGASLDRVAKLGFVERNNKKYAIVSLVFHGEPGTVIPAGFQAETSQSIVFATIEEKTIIDTSVVVLAKCTQAGIIGNVPANTITSIKTPEPGIISVNNPSEASGGRGIEIDPEMKQRYEGLPAATGSSIDAIRGAVSLVDGVINVKVEENINNYNDENGLPSRSFEVIVSGGNNQNIAEAIFEKKPVGIESYGDEDITIVDSQGKSHIIHFSRPAPVNVYLIFDIIKNGNWSVNSANEIKDNAINYVGGIDALGNYLGGVGAGGTILAWKLIAAQSQVLGIDKITVKLGKSPNPSASENLEFLIRELPVLNINNITVNVP